MIRFCQCRLPDGIPLVPQRRLRVRLIVFAALTVFILIGNPAWYKALFFAVSMALMLGTLPRFRFNESMLEREFLVMFVPVHVKQWKFDQFECILTGLEDRPLFMAILFGGFAMPVWERTLDSLFPWLGGDYIISVVPNSVHELQGAPSCCSAASWDEST